MPAGDRLLGRAAFIEHALEPRLLIGETPLLRLGIVKEGQQDIALTARDRRRFVQQRRGKDDGAARFRPVEVVVEFREHQLAAVCHQPR